MNPAIAEAVITANRQRFPPYPRGLSVARELAYLRVEAPKRADPAFRAKDTADEARAAVARYLEAQSAEKANHKANA